MLIKKNQCGATAIETALVLPIVLFLTILCIDFGRYYITRGVVEAAAQRALTYASVVPSLEDESENAAQDSTKSKDTLGNILKRVDSLLSHSGVSTGDLGQINNFSDVIQDGVVIGKYYEPICGKKPCLKRVEVRLPKPNAGETLSLALLREPIQLDLSLEYNPILPFFGHVEFPIHAVAFREPRNTATLPLLENCGLGCTCPDNPNKIIGEFGCVCPAPLIPDPLDDSKCICPGGKSLINGICSCEPCQSGWEPSPSGCGCECPLNYVDENGACVCKAPRFKLQGNACVCDPAQTCPQNSRINTTTCQCECTNSTQVMCNNNCTTNCALGQHLDENCVCVCDDETKRVCDYQCIPCDGGTIYEDTCQCFCPLGKQLCNGRCVDCPCGKKLGANCECTEENDPDAVQCGNGACDTGDCFFNGTDLEVDPNRPECGTNGVLPCRCPSDEPEICFTWQNFFSGNLENVCHPTCPPNMRRDPNNNCNCVCKDGFANCGGECVVKDCSSEPNPIIGQIPDTQSCACKCPSDKPEICNNQCLAPCGNAVGHISLVRKPEEGCSCECPAGLELKVRGTYTYCLEPCPAGTVHVEIPGSDLNGFSCACRSGEVLCNNQCITDICSASGKIPNPANCSECICPADRPVSCGGLCYPQCSSPELTRKEGSCDQCTCAANQYRCGSRPSGQQCVSTICSPNTGEVFDERSCSCGCSNTQQLCGQGNSARCITKCPAGKIFSSDCSTCICPPDVTYECGGNCYPKCPTGQSPDLNSCGTCKCDVGEKCNNGACKLCQPPYLLDKATCSCVCPSGQLDCSLTTGAPRSCQTSWACDINEVPNLDLCGACMCKTGFWECNNNCIPECTSPKSERDTSNCGCKCPSGKQECGLNNNSCGSCPNGQTLNLSNCQCECPGGQLCTNGCFQGQCPGNTELNPVTCTCTNCPVGSRLCDNNTRCETCTPPLEVKSDCSCGCPSGKEQVDCNGNIQCLEPCGPGKLRNPNTCECICETPIPDSACGIPPGFVRFNQATCSCECISGTPNLRTDLIPPPPPPPAVVCFQPWNPATCLRPQPTPLPPLDICVENPNGTGFYRQGG